MTKRTALDVYTAPKYTPHEGLAMFIARTAAQRNPQVTTPREGDVWAIMVVLEHHDAMSEIKNYSRTALGNLVGLACQLWSLIVASR